MEYTNTPKVKKIGQFIEEYRRARKLSQEKLAWYLGVDEKTLRSWEQGRVVIQIAHRMKLRDVLQIPSGMLDLRDPFTAEDALELHKRIHTFLEQGSYASVLATSDLLIQECSAPENRIHPTMQSILPHAFYTKGLATATVRNKPQEALQLFQQMEQAALELEDPIGVGISRTYQGEAYRRIGDYNKTQSLLEEVIEQFKGEPRSGMNALVVGNSLQLLGRVYLAKGEKEKALDTLQRAEELAHAATLGQDYDWYMCFCLCAVKEELAKSLMLLRRYQKSFEALEEAKRLAREAASRWAIPIAITEGELFMRYGRQFNDRSSYERGIESFCQGYKLAKEHNHFHQQHRILRLRTKWEASDAFRLECSQKLREEMRKIDGERSDE